MNSYKDSQGNRHLQASINRYITEAKAEKWRLHYEDHDYPFCTVCKRNDCKPIDCSHDISVAECKKQGRVELAWSLDNLTLTGRNCHKAKDKLNLQFSSNIK